MVVDGRYLAVEYDLNPQGWSDQHGILLWDWMLDEWTALDYKSDVVVSL